MAERRRIIPASVGPLFKDQKDTKSAPAMRLQLDLSATTEETCPEFAYPVLVKNVTGNGAKGKDGEEKSFNDIQEEDLASLAEIARKFEEKYNAPGKKGKKKRMVLEDLMDAGMGYDESDAFIDNSECYDELVPASLTTQFGGFYINSGPLKFRELADSDDGDFQSKKIKTPKKKKKQNLENGDGKERKVKRKLSSESGGNGDHMSKKAKKQLKRKLREEKKLRKKKGPRMIRTPTVAELLKRNTGGSPGSPQMPASASSSHNGPVTSATKGAPKPPTKPLSGSGKGAGATPQGMVTSSLGMPMDMSLDLGIGVDGLDLMDKDLMDVMASMNGVESMGGGVGAGVSGVGGGDVDSDFNVSPSAPGTGGEEGGAKEIVDLPIGLPQQLAENIEKIKEAARKSVEGKTKFFNAYVNGLLLRIEHGTRTLNCSKRSAVYAHLANHLPCTKLTLQKRAKKLQLGAQDNHLKEPLQRLRQAIAEVIPEQELRYKAKCEEASMKADLQPSLDAEGKVIEHKPSKRKFAWGDRLRILLCDVVKVKVKTFEISKTRTQSAEEYLKAFLDSEVKPLWPKDWIQTRNLFKESRMVHDHVTSLAGRQRKALAAGPRKLVLTTRRDGDGEGPSTNHAASPQEGEPSSTQVNDMVGSPITAKHLADVPTLMDCVGSGDDSMDAVITSSQYKGMEGAGTGSSDSNRNPSPTVGPGHQNAGHDIPVSSSSPLPNLDPNFLVEQLISQQLVSNSMQDLGGGLDGAQSTSTPGSSYGQSGVNNKHGSMSALTSQTDLMPTSVTIGLKKTAKTNSVSSRDAQAFPDQMAADFDSNQQSYAAKLSAISNIHTMRTMHTHKPGVQAKDVTSSSSGSMAMGAKRPAGVQKKTAVSQPVIRLTRDNNIEKMTSQPNSRIRLQPTNQQKGMVSSSVTNAQNNQGAVHPMTYSQTPSNTSSVQGRSSMANQRMGMGGAMDVLAQVASNVSAQVSPSQTTSHHVTYANPTLSPQRAGNMHSPGSAFSSPTHSQQMHHMGGQSPTSPRVQQPTSPRVQQQTSPSSAHKYSPNSQQQYQAARQQYSPGHTSPIAAGYSTSPTGYQSMGSGGGGYQQMSVGQTSGGGNYGNSFQMGAAQSSSQGSVPQSSVDAVITSPAHGGSFFQSGVMMPPVQGSLSPSHPLPPDMMLTHQQYADQRYVGDGSSSQHRIH